MGKRRRRAAKGSGSLYRPKRHKGWYLRIRAHGKDLTIKTKTSDRQEAERIRGRYFVEMEKGLSLDSHRVTMADLATLVIQDYRMNGYSSIKDVTRRLDNHILPFFGPAAKAMEIGPAQIEAWKRWRKEQNASNGEINREIEALTRAFNLGFQHGLLPQKPSIERMEVTWGRTTYITDKELKKILEEWPSDWTRPVIEFMNLTGWRLGEVQPLAWKENIDWQAQHVILREGETKSGKPRVFPFDNIPELKALLKRQLAITKKVEREKKIIIPWVFHRDGKEIHNFYKDWKAATDKAEITGKKRHDFRSTAARRLIREYGIAPDIARKMVGWESIQMLEYYAVTDIADIHKAVKAANTSKNTSTQRKAGKRKKR